MNDAIWSSLDRAAEWVKYAESKAVAILGIHTITLGFFLSLSVDQSELVRSSALIMITSCGAVMFTMASLFFCFRCLNPRLKLTGGVSPIYFGSIASSFRNSREFSEFYRKAMDGEQRVFEEVAGQVYITSQIAWRKFKDVGWAMRFMTFSILFWITLSILFITK